MRITAIYGISVVACISCVGPSAEHRIQYEADATRAMNSFFDHAIELVPTIDDKVSDASTIALALTNTCISDYNAYTEAKVNVIAQTSKGKLYYRRLRDSKEEKVQASLQIVLQYRTGKLISRKSKT
ncbi:hypothetical protein [Geothrix oryzae]|uniref:hypothetical protein n=1 Tax=Geothrix oryzae TaxID=2927975 RepID=UPI002573A197|nr:hypothetical protein [Geothrix oryzae]